MTLAQIINHFKSPSQLRGISFLFITMTCFSFIDICSKTVAPYTNPAFTNLLRYILLAIVTFVILKKRNQSKVSTFKETIPLMIRGVCQGATGLFYLQALQYLQLNIAVSIYFAAPLLVIVFSALFLKEKVTLKQVLTVVIGFTGVLIILRPSADINFKGAILMGIAMINFALLHVYTRKLSAQVDTWDQIFYGNIGALLLGIISIPTITEFPTNLPLSYFALIAGLVILAVMGQLFLVKAFSDAPASVLAPFNYFQLVFVILLSYFFFGETLDFISFIGIAIITASGVVSSRQH